MLLDVNTHAQAQAHIQHGGGQLGDDYRCNESFKNVYLLGSKICQAFLVNQRYILLR